MATIPAPPVSPAPSRAEPSGIEVPATVFGVDFSGAKLAGQNAFVARLERVGRDNRNFPPRFRLTQLASLGRLAGTDERGPALQHLVCLIGASPGSLWGMDFPFALPIDLLPAGITFDEQLRFAAAHTGTAQTWGRELVDLCRHKLGKLHVRRTTDIEARTPFDCYHYRIIHQTFHGMRDVLLPLRGQATTLILPFDLPKISSLSSSPQLTTLVVEACPSSTLKRLGLPHQNYKQTAAGPLTRVRLATRARIYATVREMVDIPTDLQRCISRNRGGDALDAVLAGLGAALGLFRLDVVAALRDPRYTAEGLIFF